MRSRPRFRVRADGSLAQTFTVSSTREAFSDADDAAARRDLRRRARRLRRRLLAPPPRLVVSDWCDKNRWLSQGASSAGGRWRTDKTPYLREILDAIGDAAVPEIVIPKAAQVGGSEVILNAIGYMMAEDPGPSLLIQPTVEAAKNFVGERLEPMLRDSPRLRGIVRGGNGRRHSDDTKQKKTFAGGYIAAIGSNSTAGLRSRPIRWLFVDELDEWEASVGDQGDPLELATRRTTTFHNRKRIVVSTPTVEGASKTWELWEASDQRHYEMPCPTCGEFQRLEWKNARGEYCLEADRDEAGELMPATARYRCQAEGCGALIPEREKSRMLARGRWRATHPGRRARGYHIHGLLSPWLSWAEILEKFLASRRSRDLLQVFVNTFLGLPFAPDSEKLEPTALMARAEPFGPREVLETDDAPTYFLPPSVGLVTAGVDVQKDRLEVLTVGFAAREEAFVLEWAQLYGNPTEFAVWQELDAWLLEPRGGVTPAAVCIDTGYLQGAVYRYARSVSSARRILPTKGEDGRGRLLIQRPGPVKRKGEEKPWLVGVDTAKDLLAARLRSALGAPGSVHFSDTLAPEFYAQLTAEHLVPKVRGGRVVRLWELLPGRRNEALDLTILCLAALHSLGPKTIATLASYAARRAATLEAIGSKSGQNPPPGDDDGGAVVAPLEPPRPTPPPVSPFSLPRAPGKRGGFVRRY